MEVYLKGENLLHNSYNDVDNWLILKIKEIGAKHKVS